MLAERNQDNISDHSSRDQTSENEESTHLQLVREHAVQDTEYQPGLVCFISFPDHRHQLPDQCKRYLNIRSQLSIEDDLIIYGCRLLIPTRMRQEVLRQLHESHHGSVRTKQRAKLTVYWPGIDNDIENTILAYKTCQDSLPSNPREPLIQKAKPTRPFQTIAADFNSGNHSAALVCPTSFGLTKDHNSQPSCCSQNLRRSGGFQHLTSSPLYPQSNGKTEATVKSMKKLIKAAWTGRSLDEDTLTRALLQCRNTPSRKDGLSPAQKLFGQPIQDAIPAHRRSFALQWQKSTEEAEKLEETTKEKVEESYNQHTRALPEIVVGSNVAIQNREMGCLRHRHPCRTPQAILC